MASESKQFWKMSFQLFGAKWSNLFVKKQGKMDDVSKGNNWHPKLYYLRATSPVFPLNINPFPGGKHNHVIILNTTRWNGNIFQAGAAEPLAEQCKVSYSPCGVPSRFGR